MRDHTIIVPTAEFTSLVDLLYNVEPGMAIDLSPEGFLQDNFVLKGFEQPIKIGERLFTCNEPCHVVNERFIRLSEFFIHEENSQYVGVTVSPSAGIVYIG